MVDINNEDASDSFEKRILGNINSNEKSHTTLKTDQKVLARITDGIYRHVYSALRELVCNAYDADAENVYISTDCPRFNEIIISDDGNGMSAAVLSNMLHHIGGSAKRNYKQKKLGIFDVDDPTKSPIKKRKLIGKIGIGLFSVAQLTRNFTIITKQKGNNYYLIANILLRNFSEEEIQEIEKRGEDFETGEVEVYTQQTDNISAHGTDIVIKDLKKSALDQLKSVDIWYQAISDGEENKEYSGEDGKPAFHIGEMDPNNNNIVKENSKLPWNETDAPKKKFDNLYNSLVGLQANDKYPSISKNLDNYLGMIWILGLSLPVRYISKAPEEISFADCEYIYEIQNNGTAAKILSSDQKKLTISKILNFQSTYDPSFRVFLDNIEIFRPIKFVEEVKTDAKFKDTLLFYGKFEPDISKIPASISGGNLKLEAIFKWSPRIVPKEHAGVSIRINGTTGVLFDSEFMKWQLAEYVLKKQLTVEINILEGFESALNIDRESFNVAHPHYQLVMRWLHKALKQVVNVVKAKKSNKRKEFEILHIQEQKTVLQNIVKDTKAPITYDDNDSLLKIEINDDCRSDVETYRIPRGSIEKLTSTSDSKKIENQYLPKINAIVALLDKFGLLDNLSEPEKNNLFEALIRIIAYDK